MNKEEILAMEAERGLDIQVGKHVFGWTDEKTEHNTLFEMSANMWKPNDVYHCVPKYSTYLSVTQEVIDKLKDDYDVVQLTYTNGLWTCSLIKLLGISDFESTEHQAKELPEAICKAALLSVMDS